MNTWIKYKDEKINIVEWIILIFVRILSYWVASCIIAIPFCLSGIITDYFKLVFLILGILMLCGTIKDGIQIEVDFNKKNKAGF